MIEILRGLWVVFRQMFRKPNTFQYPEEKRAVAPRFHGRHVLNRYDDGLERCIGCELCAYACPADAIYVRGADNTPEARYSVGERYAAVYQINYNRCILCGLCIEACPTRALTMTNDYELSSATRDGLLYDKPQLLAPLPVGAVAPPHRDDVEGPPAIARYGEHATVSQESAQPVWAERIEGTTRAASLAPRAPERIEATTRAASLAPRAPEGIG